MSPENSDGTPGSDESDSIFAEDPVTGMRMRTEPTPADNEEPPDLFAESGIDIDTLPDELQERARGMQAHFTKRTQEVSAEKRSFEQAMQSLRPMMAQAMAGDQTSPPPPTETPPTEEPLNLEGLISDEGALNTDTMEAYVQRRVDQALEDRVAPHVQRLNQLELDAQIGQWNNILGKYPRLQPTWESREFKGEAAAFSRRNPNATVGDIFNAVGMKYVERAYQAHMRNKDRQRGSGLTPGGPSLNRKDQQSSREEGNFASFLRQAASEATE